MSDEISITHGQFTISGKLQSEQALPEKPRVFVAELKPFEAELCTSDGARDKGGQEQGEDKAERNHQAIGRREYGG